MLRLDIPGSEGDSPVSPYPTFQGPVLKTKQEVVFCLPGVRIGCWVWLEPANDGEGWRGLLGGGNPLKWKQSGCGGYG